MKTCPFCAEEIQDATIVCKHCGRDTFRRAELPPIKEPISRVIKYGGGFLLAVIVLGVLLAVVSGNIAGPPSTNAVTMAKFQQLDTGMPYEDVRDLLGSGGTELSRSTIVMSPP